MLPVQLFHLGSGPWCSAQKLQTGFDARIKVETPNLDAPAQCLPTVVVYQLRQNRF